MRPLPFGVLALHRFDLLPMHAALICSISCGLQLAGKQLRANFLFERPQAFWIAPKKPAARLQAAE